MRLKVASQARHPIQCVLSSAHCTPCMAIIRGYVGPFVVALLDCIFGLSVVGACVSFALKIVALLIVLRTTRDGRVLSMYCSRQGQATSRVLVVCRSVPHPRVGIRPPPDFISYRSQSAGIHCVCELLTPHLFTAGDEYRAIASDVVH
jgi:hypothetical protein